MTAIITFLIICLLSFCIGKLQEFAENDYLETQGR